MKNPENWYRYQESAAPTNEMRETAIRHAAERIKDPIAFRRCCHFIRKTQTRWQLRGLYTRWGIDMPGDNYHGTSED